MKRRKQQDLKTEINATLYLSTQHHIFHTLSLLFI